MQIWSSQKSFIYESKCRRMRFDFWCPLSCCEIWLFPQFMIEIDVHRVFKNLSFNSKWKLHLAFCKYIFLDLPVWSLLTIHWHITPLNKEVAHILLSINVHWCISGQTCVLISSWLISNWLVFPNTYYAYILVC